MNHEIFTEAFLARLIPIYHEVTLGAIRHFHLEQYPPNALTAAMGGLLALAIYYGFGVWLRRMPERVSTPEQRARIEKLRAAAYGWLPWLLVLSPTPVGGVVVMAAGFFHINQRVTFASILAAEALWRAMPYLHG